MGGFFLLAVGGGFGQAFKSCRRNFCRTTLPRDHASAWYPLRPSNPLPIAQRRPAPMLPRSMRRGSLRWEEDSVRRSKVAVATFAARPCLATTQVRGTRSGLRIPFPSRNDDPRRCCPAACAAARCGGRRIRTSDTLRYACFQNKCFRPLSHPTLMVDRIHSFLYHGDRGLGERQHETRGLGTRDRLLSDRHERKGAYGPQDPYHRRGAL